MTRLLTVFTALLLATTAACVDAPTVDEVAAAATWSDTSTRPSFDLWKSTDGQHRFHLKDADGAILVTSEGYSSRTAALGGLLSVLANGTAAKNYDVRATASGGGYFNLKAANGQIIATSGNAPSIAAAQADADATRAAIGVYQAAWAAATGRRFALHLDVGGKYYWNLHAGNGEIVLRSQRYDSEAAALNGAFSVSDNGTTAARYQVLPAQNGGYYFNLTATNGQVIGTSEVYASKSNAERGRDGIIALLPTIALL
ncbi:MAG: YegP family protein [Kofleriaceae bacterium]